MWAARPATSTTRFRTSTRRIPRRTPTSTAGVRIRPTSAGEKATTRACWATSATWTASPTPTTTLCRFRRRSATAHGFTVGLAYTFGKALGEGYGRNDPSGGVNSTYQDPQQPARRTAAATASTSRTTQSSTTFATCRSSRIPRAASSGSGRLADERHHHAPHRVSLSALTGGNSEHRIRTTYPGPRRRRTAVDSANRQLWYDPTAFRRTECNIAESSGTVPLRQRGAGRTDHAGLHSFDLSLGKNWNVHDRSASGPGCNSARRRSTRSTRRSSGSRTA